MDPIIIIVNFIYTIVGALIALAVMVLGYKIFDWITPFNTEEQLKQGNQAIGTVVGAIFIGLGLAVGLVMGLGLN